MPRPLAAGCALMLLVAPIAARADGCVKGAVVGAVVGHVAGHHALAGAAVGCGIGHHEADKAERAAPPPQPSGADTSKGTPSAPQ